MPGLIVGLGSVVVAEVGTLCFSLVGYPRAVVLAEVPTLDEGRELALGYYIQGGRLFDRIEVLGPAGDVETTFFRPL